MLPWPASYRHHLCSPARCSVQTPLLAWVPPRCRMSPRQVRRRPTHRGPSLGVSPTTLGWRHLRPPARQLVSRRRRRSWYPCQLRMPPCRLLPHRTLLRPRLPLLRLPRQLRTRWTPSPQVRPSLRPLFRHASRTMPGRSSTQDVCIFLLCLSILRLRLGPWPLPSRVAPLCHVWMILPSLADGFCATCS